MVSWSTKRQLFYISIVTAFIVVVIALPIFFITYRAPSCTDKVQNQGELGVDCGGPCTILCRASVLDPIVRWERAFKVQHGIYNVLAYVENPNLDSGIRSASYAFKVYDADNVLIYERRGETFVPPRKVFAVFESTILTGERIPARTLFEFTGAPVWQKTKYTEPPLVVTGQTFTMDGTVPKVTATIQNPSSNMVSHIDVSAILYDTASNAIGASHTVVDSIERSGSAPLTFTWPEPFAEQPTRIEIVYRVLP